MIKYGSPGAFPKGELMSVSWNLYLRLRQKHREVTFLGTWVFRGTYSNVGIKITLYRKGRVVAQVILGNNAFLWNCF